MKTSIEIDQKLMEDAMKALGLTTKKATVQQALRLVVRLKQQEKIRSLRGKLKWEGDLDQMRRDDCS